MAYEATLRLWLPLRAPRPIFQNRNGPNLQTTYRFKLIESPITDTPITADSDVQ